MASLVNRQLSELANAEESVNEVITEDFSDMSEAFNLMNYEKDSIMYGGRGRDGVCGYGSGGA